VRANLAIYGLGCQDGEGALAMFKKILENFFVNKTTD
jgi:hypothetical protein